MNKHAVKKKQILEISLNELVLRSKDPYSSFALNTQNVPHLNVHPSACFIAKASERIHIEFDIGNLHQTFSATIFFLTGPVYLLHEAQL